MRVSDGDLESIAETPNRGCIDHNYNLNHSKGNQTLNQGDILNGTGHDVADAHPGKEIAALMLYRGIQALTQIVGNTLTDAPNLPTRMDDE